MTCLIIKRLLHGAGLAAALALSLSSCTSSIYRCEFYRPNVVPGPVELEPKFASSPNAIDLFTMALTDMIAGTPGAHLEAPGGGVVVRCQHRVRRYYAIGLVLPFLPLFGTFGDPKDRPIILSLSHGADVTVDVAGIRGEFENGHAPVTVAAMGVKTGYRELEGERVLSDGGDPIPVRFKKFIALTGDYHSGDVFTLEIPITGPFGEERTARVRFVREGHTLWDKWGPVTGGRLPMEDLIPFEPGPARM